MASGKMGEFPRIRASIAAFKDFFDVYFRGFGQRCKCSRSALRQGFGEPRPKTYFQSGVSYPLFLNIFSLDDSLFIPHNALDKRELGALDSRPSRERAGKQEGSLESQGRLQRIGFNKGNGKTAEADNRHDGSWHDR